MTPKLPARSDGRVILSTRARVTLDEWTRFRQLAIARNVSASDLLGEAIRATLTNGDTAK